MYETKEIDGKQYGVQKLPATKGLKLQLKLMKFIGGGVSELKGIGNESETIEAIGRMAVEVDDDAFADFVKECVVEAKLMIDAGGDDHTPIKIDFDKEFSDNYLAMWEVFLFVLEVNLGKFLQDIKSKFVARTGKRQTKKR